MPGRATTTAARPSTCCRTDRPTGRSAEGPSRAPASATGRSAGVPRDNRRMGIQELTPAQARQRQQQGVRLIDVREVHERVTGMAEGADGIDRAALEAAPQRHAPDRDAPLLLICQTGRRSMLAAETLATLGYTLSLIHI